MTKSQSGLSKAQLGIVRPVVVEAQLLPARPDGVSAAQMGAIEMRVAATIATMDDIDVVDELRRRAEALETYLVGKEGHGHAQGVARRAEARIGELLGPKAQGVTSPHAGKLPDQRWGEFRKLAALVRRGVLQYETDGDGEGSPWWSSRRALLLGPGAFSAEATGQYEWYTPGDYAEAARRVMGAIDLDPASSAEANAVIGAERYFTAEDDGLAQAWSGRVWMNPPYSSPLVGEFCAKLCESYACGDVTQAITLTYGATETGWFHALGEVGAAIAFPKGRTPYWSTREGGSAPLKGSALFYLGPNTDAFRLEFDAFGLAAML